MTARKIQETQKLVSIIMAAYNHEQYVEEALKSLFNQTYQNIEIIIIDDGSSDMTRTVIENQINQIERDIRILFISRENRGLCRTLNEAIDLARGYYIQFIASDDAYLPNKTELSVRAIEKTAPNVAAIYTDGFVIDKYSGIKGAFSDLYPVPAGRNLHRELLISNWIPAIGLLYRRSSLIAVNKFDPSLKYEDWDLLLRITKRFNIVRCKEKSFLYRVHGQNTSLNTKFNENIIQELISKHEDLRRFHIWKEEFKLKPLQTVLRNWRDWDLVIRIMARRFTKITKKSLMKKLSENLERENDI